MKRSGREWCKIKNKDHEDIKNFFNDTKSPAGNLEDFYNKPTEYLQIRKLVNQKIILWQRRALQNLLAEKEEIEVTFCKDDGLSNWHPGLKKLKKFKSKEKRRLMIGVICDMDKIKREMRRKSNEIDEITNILEQRGILQRENDIYFYLATLMKRPYFLSTERTTDADASDDFKSRDHNEYRNQEKPSDVVKSNNCDYIEKRRYCVRKEVSALQQNNQSKPLDLSRRSVLDEESKDTSKSNSAFDLKSIDKALPPPSHCSTDELGKNPGILKLQDIILNNMKRHRPLHLAATRLMSLETAIEKKADETGD